MASIKMVNLKKLEEIESLIKSGQQVQARAQLVAVKPEQVSPVDLVYFCSLLRRARMSVEVIKILQPLVYPKARSAAVATIEEKLEYASNLIRLGALSEAERILNSIDADKYPVVLIRKGFLVISSWDYKKANQYFKSYIDHPHAEAYSVIVAKVNYLQGLVYLREVEQAWILAQQLLQELDPVKNRFLLGAVCEFSAGIFRQKKDKKRALQFIEQGKQIFINSESTDEFLLRKQEQIILGDIEGLRKIREEAVERDHYESVRDIDFHIALVKKNEKLLTQIYWKTKSSFYKERILQYAIENKIKVDSHFFKFSKNKGIVFDLESHQLNGSNMNLKKNKAEARLLKALLVEAYNPIKIYDLFASVYPDEIFFPDYSSDKIHQLLKRLRQFIQKAQLPIEVVCEKEKYKVVTKGNFSLSSEIPYQSQFEIRWQQQVRRNYFTVQQAQEFWACSLRTTFRRLDELKKIGRIQSFGKTRSVRYRFV